MSESWICQHCGNFNYSYRSKNKSTTVTQCKNTNCNLYIKQALQSPQTYSLTAISFLTIDEYIYISRPIRDQKRRKFWLIQLAQITTIQNQSHVLCSILNKDKTPNKQQQFVFSSSDIAKIKDTDCIRLKNAFQIKQVEKTREFKYAPSIPFYSNMYFRCDWYKPFNNKLDLLCYGYSKKIYSKRIASSIIDIICNVFYCHSVKAFNCPLFYWYDPQSEYHWDRPMNQRFRGVPKIQLKLLSSFINLGHIRSEKDQTLCEELSALNENELELYPSWTDEDIHSCFEVLFVKHENINLDAIEMIDKKLIEYFLNEIQRNKKQIETEVGVHFDWYRNMDLDNIDVKIVDLNVESMGDIKWLRHNDFFQTYQSYDEYEEMFMTEDDLEKNCKIKVKQVVNDKIQPFFSKHFKDCKVIVLEKGSVLIVLILGVTKAGNLAGYTGYCKNY